MLYRKEIDGLRAFAVVPVILFHAGFSVFKGGFVGVDIFFVISGYLITSILLNEIDKGRFSLVNFYERRARRILPALYAVMIVSILFSWLILMPSDMRDFSESIVAISLFSSNILFWSESGYFDTISELKPLLHTWSLAVEEQFYVFFPLVLLLVWRFGKKVVLPVLLLIFFSSLIISEIAVNRSPSAAFYLLPTRAWELMVGALCAFFLSYSPNFFESLANKFAGGLLSCLGLFIVLYSIFAFDKYTPFPGVNALVPTLGAALIILFSSGANYVGRFLSANIFVGIGLISYSTYLWHQPIFAFLRYMHTSPPQSIYFAVAITLTFILAYFSWKYIEAPFRCKSTYSRKAIFSLSLVFSLLLIAFGTVGHYSNGFEKYRFSAKELELIGTTASSPLRDLCHFPQNAEALSRTPCKTANVISSVAVVGNSHATELAYSLETMLRDSDIGVVYHTISGCKHNYNVPQEAGTICSRWHEKVISSLVNDENIKYVVISYRNEAYIKNEVYFNSLRDMTSVLSGAGKKVILVMQAPLLSAHINQVMARLLHTDYDFVHSLVHWNNIYLEESALAASLHEETIIFNPADYFCSEDICYAVKDGIALYFDDNHMSLESSKMISKDIVNYIK